jgi:sec-independent protein translocase protein TatA
MFSGLESPFHLLIVLAIAILVLGVFKPKQIPEAARSLGSGIRQFRSSLSGEDRKPEEDRGTEGPPPPGVDPPDKGGSG